MRDDDRTLQQRKKPRPAGSQATGTNKSATRKPVARPSNMNDDAYRRPSSSSAQRQPARKPQNRSDEPVRRPKSTQGSASRPTRRDAEYLYPDDAYYRKGQPQRSSGKKSPTKKKKKKRTNPLYTLFYIAFAVVAALLVAFLLRSFVCEVVQVQGDAMAYTLDNGDWVLATKFDYRSQDSNPQMGDIVLVNLEKQNGKIIRRVVGLPEQTVEITGGGDTLINGETISEPNVSLMHYQAMEKREMERGRYFVMSDNRSVTMDSRDELVGNVKKNQLSKVRMVVWPPSKWKDLG
ncbi:signal peptidase I [Eubacteriales bacterium OttesenSCG-928-N13]|nr:signal peptidase I [Eubacteriales bacterium OttesenSCG-928-N13]